MNFIERFVANFKKRWGKAPLWIHTGQLVINYAAPIILAIIAQFDPATALLVGPVIAEIETDMATIDTFIGDGTVTSSLLAALTRVQSNLEAILAAGHIKDTKLTADITVVLSELKTFASSIPAL